MTDTLAETVQAPLKRPCNEAIDPVGLDKRQRVDLEDPSDILNNVRAVQSTIGEVRHPLVYVEHACHTLSCV